MNEAVSRGLSRVLRNQLTAVQQLFIHILSLRAWKEAAVADRITSIDAVDLPNAMRIVDCLVSAGHLPALASDREALAGDMPEPGGSLDTVLAAELALDLRLGNVLASVERELTPCAGAGKVPLELVSVPLANRAAYQDWLRKRVVGPRDGAEDGGPKDPATLCVDALFASLMVMIDQTLVHAFVHWHRGEHELADTTWEMSGAAMMHATRIVNALAPRQVAPRPAPAVARDNVDVALPRMAAATDAPENDRRLAGQCLSPRAGPAGAAARGTLRVLSTPISRTGVALPGPFARTATFQSWAAGSSGSTYAKSTAAGATPSPPAPGPPSCTRALAAFTNTPVADRAGRNGAPRPPCPQLVGKIRAASPCAGERAVEAAWRRGAGLPSRFGASEWRDCMNTALQWRRTDDTRYIAYLMAESAGNLRALHGAAREIPQYHSSHAAPMLLAFAMERALKAWHLRTTGEAAKRTHCLLALYEALPKEVRECLDEAAGTALRPYPSMTSSGRSRLAEVLAAHDTAFHDCRYPEEVLADPERPNGLFFETGEHEAALDAVLEAFDWPAENGVRAVHMGTLGNAGARTTMRTRD